ncbi:sensor histidine kinase [Planctomycetes bacterium K23_9]|uniref:Sensor histidine kinase LiaS n=1 Tax=Stieleria marina TaxID=1930275 RepID=A0A517P1G9_9BACT|nr:Sensor histidine kinase LiaS [Planctomycetes bacterium K23_9]
MTASDPSASDSSAIEAIEIERAQIAHEVHDALLPLIVGAKAALESHLGSDLADHADRRKLQQAFDWLDQAAQVGRQLLLQTHPPELDQATWTAAAKYACSQLVSGDVELQWDLSPECDLYPSLVAGAAYRIVIEAIRNGSRHGNASQIKVTGDATRVKVTDNGSGFDPGAVSADRFGIRSMRGRAKLVGGQVEIKSQIGGPTTVVFLVPVDE